VVTRSAGIGLLVPHVVSSEKNPPGMPKSVLFTETDADVMLVSVTLPVLVSVNELAALDPLFTVPKLNVDGVNVAEITGATLIPVRATGEPVTATFPLIASVPGTVAAVPVGWKATVIVQVAAAAVRVVPQDPPTLTN